MKFQICTCKRHLFIHGNFFDEIGPYIKEFGGLVHLSGDMFSRVEVFLFIQKSFQSKKIILEEACELARDPNILLLPEERTSGLALYQKNENARVKRIMTLEGERQLAVIAEPKYSLKRFVVWLKRQVSVLSFFVKLFFIFDTVLFPCRF